MAESRIIPLSISKENPGTFPNASMSYRSLICDAYGAAWISLTDGDGSALDTVNMASDIPEGAVSLIVASGVYGRAAQEGTGDMRACDSIAITAAGIAPSVSALTGLACASVPLLTDGDAFVPARGIPPNGTSISRDEIPSLQGTAALGYAYDEVSQDWLPLVTATAATLAQQSGFGSLIATRPGEWTLTAAPAAATVASATRAAGAASVRHVLTSFSGDLNAVAAQAVPVVFVVRDGAAGVGTILYQRRLIAQAGASAGFGLTGLNIIGSAGTAMTVEVTAAPAATNFATVSASGYSVDTPA